MHKTAALLMAAAALTANAQGTAATDRNSEPSHTARVQERYCEKLRESPEAYVQFVRRMQTVHGYTYSDFAATDYGPPMLAVCKAQIERLAAKSTQQATR